MPGGDEGAAEARTCFSRALAVRARELGEDHPDALAARVAIGHAQALQGDLEGAEAECGPRALSLALACRQPLTHTHTPSRLQNVYQRALDALGEGHPFALSCAAKLAEVQLAAVRWPPAAPPAASPCLTPAAPCPGQGHPCTHAPAPRSSTRSTSIGGSAQHRPSQDRKQRVWRQRQRQRQCGRT